MTVTIEKAALGAAALITSYAPESMFANETPGLYGLLMSNARDIMEAVGIEPESNIRCWFWQIEKHLNPKENFDTQLRIARLRKSPILKTSLWYADDGHLLSDNEFRALWPN